MSRKDEIQRLINHHSRRLQKLKEQQAIQGLNVHPQILMEIEDIQEEIQQLRIDLTSLTEEDEHEQPLDTETSEISSQGIRGGAIKSSDWLINTGGGAYVGGSVSTGGGDFVGRDKIVHGDEVRGDKVMGGKAGRDIYHVSHVSGTGVAIGPGAQATASQAGGGQDLVKLFAEIYQKIEDRPEDPNVEKEELVGTVEKIQKEVAKGEQANPTWVERRLKTLALMAPDIFEVTVACLTHPLAGIATIIRKVAEKAKAEESKT